MNKEELTEELKRFAKKCHPRYFWEDFASLIISGQITGIKILNTKRKSELEIAHIIHKKMNPQQGWGEADSRVQAVYMDIVREVAKHLGID